MKLEEYVYRDQKRLRCGYTTGSCAAAAAKAAAQMLLSGERVDQVALSTPKGILLQLPVGHIRLSEESVSCAVQKDSGDDPDVTDGVWVFAEVRRATGGIYCRRRGHWPGDAPGACLRRWGGGHQSRPAPDDRQRFAGGWGNLWVYRRLAGDPFRTGGETACGKDL